MAIEIQQLYDTLESVSTQSSSVRDWAAMQSLHRKIQDDPGVAQIFEKVGARPLVEAVLKQLDNLSTNDGFSPHYLVHRMEFQLFDNVSVVILPNKTSDPQP
jgi:hypothetical protein